MDCFRLSVIMLLALLLNSTRVSGDRRSLVAKLEDRVEDKLGQFALVVTKWLEAFNDRHFAGTELGRLIQYEKIKPNLDETTRSKKMTMAMMPMIFHIGAISTLVLLTAIMTTKSVVIGLTLLVFKIAIAVAKLTSFFTEMKESKHHHYEWSPPVHYEHPHDKHARSMPSLESHHQEAASFDGYAYASHAPAQQGSYSQDWSPSEGSTASTYVTPSSGYYYRRR